MRGFGELEAAIMARVWASGTPLLVREVHATLRRFAERIDPAEAEELREALAQARPAGGSR